MVTVQHSSSILALKGIPSRRRPVGSEEEGSITCWIDDLKAGDLAAAHPLLLRVAQVALRKPLDFGRNLAKSVKRLT